MTSGADLGRDLVEAETRLRALGLTGSDAFDAVLDTLRARLGDGGQGHPSLDGLLHGGDGLDRVGLAYERFFPDLFKGRVGQFFTPPPIVRLLLSRLPLGPGVRVLDPTCGSGGLLVPAGRTGADVRGIDVDPRMVELATVSLRLAGIPGDVRRADVFTVDPEPADVVVANPPFSVPVRDPAVLARHLLGRDRTQVVSDVLFLEALERFVRPGGFAGLVLPWTIVANPSLAPVRAHVDARWRRLALCALPEGVFRPFGGAAGRAALLWLQRRPCADGPMAYATLSDPSYDVRSSSLRATDPSELDARIAGEGWEDVPDGWLPAGPTDDGEVPLSAWVAVRDEVRRFEGVTPVVELADVDRATGELRPRAEALSARRPVLRGGDVLVARMRPELGNVALPPDGFEGAGSPEWIRLVPGHHPHWLFHALRSPSWRARLPPTTGQTRPRTTPADVLATALPMPPVAVMDRVEALSSRWRADRERLRQALCGLQDAVDGFVAGELDADALDAALTRLEGP